MEQSSKHRVSFQSSAFTTGYRFPLLLVLLCSATGQDFLRGDGHVDTPHLALVLAYGYRQQQICSDSVCHSQTRIRGSILARTQAHANKSSLFPFAHADRTLIGFIHDEKLTSFSGFSTWEKCPFFLGLL